MIEMMEAYIIFASVCGSQVAACVLLAIMFRYSRDPVIWLLLLFCGTSLSAVTIIFLHLAGVL